MPDIDLGSVAGGSRRLRGYVARPAGDGPWPGVVVIHEALGADEVMRRHTDRVAAAGYLAVLPDLFSDGGTARCVMGTFRAMFSGHGKAFVDIETARQWLLDQPDCTGRVGVIGFCMGGGFALLAAARGFDASAVNYAPQPVRLEQALTGACPMVASYGGSDRLLPPRSAQRLERALTKLDVPHDVKEYPGAGHSFLNDAPNAPRLLAPVLRVANVGPVPGAAADAWARIERFFSEQLA
jgi:carboxymethylenebutenolidase